MTNLTINTETPGTDATDQRLLFTIKKPSDSPAGKSYLAVDTTERETTVSAPPPIEPEKPLTLPELFERIFQSMCVGRRWEKERLLGSTDEELGKAFGTCYCFGRHDAETNLEFQSEGEPTLRVTHKLLNAEIATLTAPEVAVYVRRIAEIPERKESPERERLLEELLTSLRTNCRREILSYIRNMIGERRPPGKKKRTKEEPPKPPTLAEQIANLLFTPDCFTEQSDGRLLIKITRSLVRKANIETLKAVEHTLNLMKRAQLDWNSATGYWLQEQRTNAYKSGKESLETAPS